MFIWSSVMPLGRCVHIVDADAVFRAHGARLLRSAGYDVHTHASGDHFLASQPDRNPGCVLLDIHVPEPDGLDVQVRLVARGLAMPVILFTGDNDIGLAARAMRAGALRFLEKPYADADLLSEVADAFGRLDATEAGTDRKAAAEARLALLSPREKEVMERLLAGLPNKLIAHALGVSVRTVEMHRHHVMEKLQARSLVAVFRLWVDARWETSESGLVELPSTPEARTAP